MISAGIKMDEGSSWVGMGRNGDVIWHECVLRREETTQGSPQTVGHTGKVCSLCSQGLLQRPVSGHGQPFSTTAFKHTTKRLLGVRDGWQVVLISSHPSLVHSNGHSPQCHTTWPPTSQDSICKKIERFLLFFIILTLWVSGHQHFYNNYLTMTRKQCSRVRLRFKRAV